MSSSTTATVIVWAVSQSDEVKASICEAAAVPPDVFTVTPASACTEIITVSAGWEFSSTSYVSVPLGSLTLVAMYDSVIVTPASSLSSIVTLRGGASKLS